MSVQIPTTVSIGSLTGENVTVPERWTFADATARASATNPNTGSGYIVTQIGRLAFQASDSTYWRLASITPTWTAVGGGSVTTDGVTINASGAGSSLQVIDGGISTAKLADGSVTTAKLTRTGEISQWSGASAPSGTVFCDGTSYLRAGAKAALFAVIGTAYGSADGTHFNVPDLRSRFALGVGDGSNGLTVRARGDVGGAEAVALARLEIPNHVHTLTSGAFVSTSTSNGVTAGGDFNTFLGFSTDSGNSPDLNSGPTGNAHENMSPYCAINFIIYT